MSIAKKEWLATYKGPVAGALFAAIVLFLWIVDVNRGLREESHDPLRRYAQGLAVSIESMLFSGKEVYINERHLSLHFNRIIGQTPHVFFILLKRDENIICPAGELPKNTNFDTTFGERVEGETLILWKRVGDYFEPPQEPHLGGNRRMPPPPGQGGQRGWINPGPPRMGPPGWGPRDGPPAGGPPHWEHEMGMSPSETTTKVTSGWRRRLRPRRHYGHGPPMRGHHGPPGGRPGSRQSSERPGPVRPYKWGNKEGPQKLESGNLLFVVGLSLRHGKMLTSNRSRNSIFLFAIFALLSVGILYAWTQSISASIVTAELEKEKTEREHLEELGLTAAGLAHETKNPIGIMLGLAQRIARHPGDAEEVRHMAEQIQDAADRASGRLGEFLKYSRLREPKIEVQNGQELIKRIVTALSPDFEVTGVSLDVETEPLSFKCDKDMITQVLVNLLINSLHACKEGGRVLISLKKDQDFGKLTVKDSGCGISNDLLNDVFKPYVTGKENGHGLGLAVTKRVIELHEWTIDVSSEEGQGTEFTVGNIEVTPTKEA
mgnify:CR=1 FL=1